MIITILEDSDKAFRSLCAGAGGYIVKNSNTDDIIKNIAEALSGGAPLSLRIAKMASSLLRMRKILLFPNANKLYYVKLLKVKVTQRSLSICL